MRPGLWLPIAAVVFSAPMASAGEGKEPAAARAEAAQWIEVLKKDPSKRKDVAVELGKIGEAAGAAIPVLAALTGDRDDAIRGNAVWALGMIAGPRYEPVTECPERGRRGR